MLYFEDALTVVQFLNKRYSCIRYPDGKMSLFIIDRERFVFTILYYRMDSIFHFASNFKYTPRIVNDNPVVPSLRIREENFSCFRILVVRIFRVHKNSQIWNQKPTLFKVLIGARAMSVQKYLLQITITPEFNSCLISSMW